MGAKYGMPYKGSKDKIAEGIMHVLPDAEIFVDLFGGGGAMTDCALTSGKFRKAIYNELDSVVFDGFRKAVSGEYAKEKRWISRDDFFALKDSDFYAACCFSFGNGCKNYAYSKEIEPWKKALHYARVYGDFSEMEKFGIHTDGTRKDITSHKDEYKQKYIKWYMKNVMLSDKEYNLRKEELERNIKEESERLRQYLIDARDRSGVKSSDVDKHLGTNGMAGHYFGRSQWEFPTRENYIKMQEIMPALDRDFDDVVGLPTLWQSLQRLESLESLERLQRLERLELYNLSYEQVKIPDNSVVYCDIPYRDTSSYNNDFDYDAFYKWALSQPFPVFVSEYCMPENFHVIAEWNRVSLLSPDSRKQETEKLFCTKKLAVDKQLSFFD